MAEVKIKQQKRRNKPSTIVVIKTIVSANETLFPEKVKKAEQILRKTYSQNIFESTYDYLFENALNRSVF
ncbi:MAG TPA: hypothetical protein VGB84_05310 [Arachidicoccus sp.]